MSRTIHPSAFVHPSVELGEDVQIGPHAVVEAHVRLGDRCVVGAQAFVAGPSSFGVENVIGPHACVGTEPQDLKYKGEPTRLEVGDRNQFREFCTANRGTVGGGGVTRIGSDNLFMVYSHVAHDCQVGSHTVFANSGTLAGHVEVGDWATVGAFSAVHQFSRVGAHAYIGGFTRVLADVLPYSRTVGVGNRTLFMGTNRIGLRRRGFTVETIRAIEQSLRLLTRSGLNVSGALVVLREQQDPLPEIRYLVEFVESSKRGVIRAVPQRRKGAAEDDDDAGGDS